MAGAREELDRLIRQLEGELRALKSARRSLDQRELQGKAAGRFVDWRPLDAVRVLLNENGGKMERGALEQELLDGGIAVGKKRAAHNVRVSIDLNLRIGNLREVEGFISVTKS